MGREMDDAIPCCYVHRASRSVYIFAGNLRVVVSAEEAGQALQRETQVDPLSEVISALAEGRGDHLAVNGAAAELITIPVGVSFDDRGMRHDMVSVRVCMVFRHAPEVCPSADLRSRLESCQLVDELAIT